MRNSFASTSGLKLVRTPSARAQAARRQLVVVSALVALAASGAAIGIALAPQETQDARTSPFSYFPSE